MGSRRRVGEQQNLVVTAPLPARTPARTARQLAAEQSRLGHTARPARRVASGVPVDAGAAAYDEQKDDRQDEHEHALPLIRSARSSASSQANRTVRRLSPTAARWCEGATAGARRNHGLALLEAPLGPDSHGHAPRAGTPRRAASPARCRERLAPRCPRCSRRRSRSSMRAWQSLPRFGRSSRHAWAPDARCGRPVEPGEPCRSSVHRQATTTASTELPSAGLAGGPAVCRPGTSTQWTTAWRPPVARPPTASRHRSRSRSAEGLTPCQSSVKAETTTSVSTTPAVPSGSRSGS
jgi:hypothetical protein